MALFHAFYKPHLHGVSFCSFFLSTQITLTTDMPNDCVSCLFVHLSEHFFWSYFVLANHMYSFKKWSPAIFIFSLVPKTLTCNFKAT